MTKSTKIAVCLNFRIFTRRISHNGSISEVGVSKIVSNIWVVRDFCERKSTILGMSRIDGQGKEFWPFVKIKKTWLKGEVGTGDGMGQTNHGIVGVF